MFYFYVLCIILYFHSISLHYKYSFIRHSVNIEFNLSVFNKDIIIKVNNRKLVLRTESTKTNNVLYHVLPSHTRYMRKHQYYE